MKKIQFAFFTLLLLAAACGTEPNQDSQPDDGAEATHLVSPTEVRLVCQLANDPNDNYGAPQHEVFLYLGENKVKVADVLACETIEPSAYGEHQIPASAIIAVGGWWAGGGEYLYVIEEGGNYVVKKGEIFEESEDNSYNYKTVIRFSHEGKEVM